MSVITIPSGDNYIYLYHYGDGEALVVDPGTAAPVLERLAALKLHLTMVLLTHHHGDHTGGVAELKKMTGCAVLGSEVQRISSIDRPVGDGDIILAGREKINVIATPGHTRASVCYYVQPSNNTPGILWTGDTMFACGCGRLLECDAATMYASLMKLAALPDETLVYCGHDYTLENCRFAAGIEPANLILAQRLRDVQKAEHSGSLTVPSTIAQEKKTNPFLRTAEPAVKAGMGMAGADAAKVFAELRRRKDVF